MTPQVDTTPVSQFALRSNSVFLIFTSRCITQFLVLGFQNTCKQGQEPMLTPIFDSAKSVYLNIMSTPFHISVVRVVISLFSLNFFSY